MFCYDLVLKNLKINIFLTNTVLKKDLLTLSLIPPFTSTKAVKTC